MEKINSLSTQLVKCCFCDFLKVKMHTVSYIHFFYLGLCLLTLTSSVAAGPETLCGAELVDALQFVCGDRGFYFRNSCERRFSSLETPNIKNTFWLRWNSWFRFKVKASDYSLGVVGGNKEELIVLRYVETLYSTTTRLHLVLGLKDFFFFI
nr:insulin-like growth factor I isoform X2 [Anas platyrhynchos]